MTAINVVRIHNILNPRDCSRELLKIKPTQSLADLFPMPVGQAHPYGLSVNGRVIDVSERATTFPQDGDYVVVSVMPAGDGAKSILRIVALIALAAFAPALGALMGPGMFGAGVLGLSAAAWTGIIMVSGVAIINSLLPPPKPPKVSNDSGSPSYGIDGAKNTSAEGIAVPLSYGQFRTAGNVVGSYVVNDGNTQILHMLIVAGEGPIASISDIEINDQPIDNYTDWSVETRLGEPDATPIDWFAGSITPVNVGQEFTEAWKTFTVGTVGSDVFDAMRFDVVAPSGIFDLSKSGRMLSLTVPIQIEYREAGTSNAWQPVTLSDVVLGYNDVTEWVDGVPYVGPVVYDGDTILVDGGTDNGTGKVVGYIRHIPIYGTTSSLDITGAQREALRRSFNSSALTQGAYEVRYRRLTPKTTADDQSDAVYLTDINKIINEQVAYRNTAVLALKIRLSDQLNGLPNVTFLNGGKLIKVFDETTGAWSPTLQSSANPAWIVYDILTNKRYGAGANEGRILLSNWRDWASWCDEQELQFHGVFDQQTNVWDAATTVSRCGRAQLTPVGTKYGVVIERAQAASQMFSVANILSGTFKENWTSLTDRANEVEVTYNDKTDKYRTRTVRLYDQAALAAGQPQKVAQVEIRGIVSAARAFEEAQLMLNLNRHVQRSVEFAAPIEAIACSVGDVVLVQHDMPAWGAGGLLESGSTTSSIKLDRPVQMEHGKTYALMANYDALVRYTGTVHSVVGDIIVLTSFSGTPAVKRIVVGTKELQVDSVVMVGANYGVSVASTTGVTAGQAVTLYDTNAMVSVPVVNPLSTGQIAEFTEVSTATPLPQAPAQYSKWLFGETNKVAKPFRVTSISGSHEYRRDIRAIEYSDSVYDLTGSHPVINYSSLAPRLVSDAIIEEVVEASVYKDSFYETEVTVTFRSPQSSYKESSVYMSLNGGTFQRIGTGKNKFTVTAIREDEIVFKVVASDIYGNSASFSSAPSISYTVLGLGTPPSNVTGLAAAIKPLQVQITWAVPDDVSYVTTELRVGSTWASATPLVTPGPNTSAGGTFNWPRPANGTYTILARHINREGLLSVTTASTPITVDSSIDAAGSPGAPSIGAILSPEVIALPADSSGAVTSYAANTSSLLINLGGVNDTGNWTITQTFASAGLTTSLTGATLTISSMSAGLDAGYVDLQATRSGYSTITKRITVVKTKAGATGSTGTAGSTGDKIATVMLYYWSATTPADPNGPTNYNWTTLAHTGTTPNGWASSIPANPGTAGIQLWTCQKAITATAATTSSAVSWTAGTFLKQAITANGQQGTAGTNGANGARFATVRAYKWSLAPAPTATGTATYTWASGSISAAPSGWSLVAPEPPSQGLTLWEAMINLVDTATTATTAINWTTALINAVGYAGTNGATGSTGAQGTSARVAYCVATGGAGAVPSTPTSATVAGDNLPTTGYWGQTWFSSAPAPAVGQSVWISDGLFNPATNITTWYAPYLASLRVGSLSAVSVNTGNLTVNGTLQMGSGGVIRSSNYTAGPSGDGYQLTETTVELPASSIRGTLTGNQITGQNIEARHMKVLGSAGHTLNPDPQCADLSAWLVNSGTIQSTALSDGVAGNYALRFTGAANIFSGTNGSTFTVRPGRTYRLRFWAKKTSGTGVLYARLRYYNNAGVELSEAPLTPQTGFPSSEAATLTSTWTEFSGTVGPLPTDAVKANLRLYGNWPAGSGDTYLQDVRLEEMADWSLVVTGGLKADNIDTRGLSIKDALGNVILAAGSPLAAANITPDGAWLNSNVKAGRNLIPALNLWNLSGGPSTQIINTELRSPDSYAIRLHAATDYYTVAGPTSPVMALPQNSQYTVSFMAYTTAGTRQMYCDLYPDTLPQSLFTITTTPTLYKATWTIGADANADACILRFFSPVGAGDVHIYAVQLEVGTEYTPWKPSNEAVVSTTNKISAVNISTYMAAAAIGWAQIGDLVINTTGGIRSGKTAYGSGTGWLLEYNSGTPRFDIGGPEKYLRFDGTEVVQSNVKSVGYIPGAAVGASHIRATSGATQCACRFDTDGIIRAQSNSGSFTLIRNWYAPTQTGIGTGKYIRFSLLQPFTRATSTESGVFGPWQELSSNRSVGGNGNFTVGETFDTAIIAYDIATDSSGTNIVSSGTIYLNMGYSL